MSEKPKYNPNLEDLLRRQQERLAARPETEQPATPPPGSSPLYDNDAPKTTITTGWIPEEDVHIRAIVGKLAEELTEAAKACARVLVQGLYGVDPKTKMSNHSNLAQELSDVMATTMYAQRNLQMQPDEERIIDKIKGYDQWHRLINEYQAKPGPLDWHEIKVSKLPPAMHVFVAYFSQEHGEWVVDVQPSWQIEPHYTHWKPMGKMPDGR